MYRRKPSLIYRNFDKAQDRNGRRIYTTSLRRRIETLNLGISTDDYLATSVSYTLAKKPLSDIY